MPPRRTFRFVSLAIHLIVFGWVISISVLDVGPLPTPRVAAMAYHDMTVVRFADIPLPAVRRETVAPSRLSTVAPIDVPDAITPERPASPNTFGAEGPTPIGSVVDGLPGAIDGLGAPTIIAPPPRVPVIPPTPVRVSSLIQSPKKITHVAPRYPAVAQASHVQGVVTLDAVIDATGAVQSVSVVRSIPLLDQAAVDAVRQWRFTPTVLNGQPVPVILTVTVNFTLR